MLIGNPEERVVAAIGSLIGTDVATVAEGREPLPQVDIVSGATVTVLVMGDSVLRASIALVRQGRLQEAEAGPAAPAAAPERSLREESGEARGWEELVGDGSVRRLSLSVGDVNEAFERTGIEEAIERPERGTQEGEAEALTGELAEPLWIRMWRANAVEIGIAAAAIAVLAVIFFFQDALVKRYTLFVWVRRGFLAFTLVWIGWIANAQLSVVNVLTFTNSLITGFSWTYFLSAPLIFIFWVSVAGGILFWGRGPFCGWLCPFGALQELLNNAARAVKTPQIKVPCGLNERLRPIKYIVLLGLFGLSLYSIAMAEIASEVEPFKTAITLKFMRAWPFVLFAVALLVMRLFIERFFCRYLCPLGAALAIPSRIAMFFPWLKRHQQCGSSCQRCANECPVQCIHPDGHINPNECIWCMRCQDLYWDDHRCPAMIQKRLRREKVGAAPPIDAPPRLKPTTARASAVAGHPDPLRRDEDRQDHRTPEPAHGPRPARAEISAHRLRLLQRRGLGADPERWLAVRARQLPVCVHRRERRRHDGGLADPRRRQPRQRRRRLPG